MNNIPRHPHNIRKEKLGIYINQCQEARMNYTVKEFNCQAKRLPKMGKLALDIPNVEQQIFFRFVNTRLNKVKYYYEHKVLFINAGGKSHSVMSGQYVVIKEDGDIIVVGPNAFKDLFSTC